MKALSVIPGTADSADMVDWPEPQAREDALLVKSRGIGICGTDVEIIAGDYGEAPPTEERLILGHESLGEVLGPARQRLRARPTGRRRRPPSRPGAV